MLSQVFVQQNESWAQTFCAHVEHVDVSFVPLVQVLCVQVPTQVSPDEPEHCVEQLVFAQLMTAL